MLFDMFSMFDPSTHTLHHFSQSLWWTSHFALLFLLVPTLYVGGSRYTTLLRLSLGTLIKWIDKKVGFHLKGMTHIIAASIIVILLTNLTGQLPYTFPVSALPAFSMSIALPIWLGLTISSLQYAPSRTLANFIPSGTPLYLTPIVAIAEFMSALARPMSHCARLTINTSLGHLYLKMAASSTIVTLTQPTPPLYTLLLTLLTIGLMFFEMIIALIQSYIFCFLLTMYASDHPKP